MIGEHTSLLSEIEAILESEDFVPSTLKDHRDALERSIARAKKRKKELETQSGSASLTALPPTARTHQTPTSGVQPSNAINKMAINKMTDVAGAMDTLIVLDHTPEPEALRSAATPALGTAESTRALQFTSAPLNHSFFDSGRSPAQVIPPLGFTGPAISSVAPLHTTQRSTNTFSTSYTTPYHPQRMQNNLQNPIPSSPYSGYPIYSTYPSSSLPMNNKGLSMHSTNLSAIDGSNPLALGSLSGGFQDSPRQGQAYCDLCLFFEPFLFRNESSSLLWLPGND
jgi:hypothetical protein